MPRSLGNNKPADQDREEAGMLWLFALITFLVLAMAGFINIIF